MSLLPPKEKALEILQSMGGATIGTADNNGQSLSLGIAKLLANRALILVAEVCPAETIPYWMEVHKELKSYE